MKICKKKALEVFPSTTKSECKEKCNGKWKEQCNFITIWKNPPTPDGGPNGCALFQQCDKLRINNNLKVENVDDSVVLAKNGATCPME